jgi:hypothetical protein
MSFFMMLGYCGLNQGSCPASTHINSAHEFGIGADRGFGLDGLVQ